MVLCDKFRKRAGYLLIRLLRAAMFVGHCFFLPGTPNEKPGN